RGRDKSGSTDLDRDRGCNSVLLSNGNSFIAAPAARSYRRHPLHTIETLTAELPEIITELPGPRARAIMARDARVLSPSYTRGYPLVVDRAEGAMVTDVDGNHFLDFNAGIGVAATG